MSWYDQYILPPFLNCVCGLKPMRYQREKIVPRAKGAVLEIGIGSGHNLPFYNGNQVTSLFAVDPYYKLNKTAQRIKKEASYPITITRDSAENLPLEDKSIDSIICTYTLCSLKNPKKALQEMKRVLRDTGFLYIVEHGLAHDADVAAWQHRLNPLWKPLAGGCNLNLNIADLLHQTQWNPSLNTMYLPKTPKIVGFNYLGSATLTPI